MDKHISQGCSRIESLQNDEEVKCIVELNKDTYFYWFIDYSACFFNAKGERIEAPINEFDFILDFKTLGHIDGKEHYVFKATNWGTQRDHVFMICDIDGETKFCRDIIDNPKYSIEEFLNDEKYKISNALERRPGLKPADPPETGKDNIRRIHF